MNHIYIPSGLGHLLLIISIIISISLLLSVCLFDGLFVSMYTINGHSGVTNKPEYPIPIKYGQTLHVMPITRDGNYQYISRFCPLFIIKQN